MRAHDQLTYLGRLRGMDKGEASQAASRWLEVFELGDRGGDRVEALSHGNQQRVQLAAALVHDPELLVLDEPFSGLDPLAVDTMSAILRSQAAAGKAVVFSSHQLDLVEDLCDRVVIIDHGSVVLEGAVDDLKDTAPIRHLELEIDGDPAPLLATLDGVHQIRSDGDRHRLTIDSGTDVRRLLAGAEEVGRLRHFSYTAPSLSDLFREAVGDLPPEEAE
jgi:ABC-2 type transport system ATP-binding protein